MDLIHALTRAVNKVSHGVLVHACISTCIYGILGEELNKEFAFHNAQRCSQKKYRTNSRPDAYLTG